MVDITRFTGGSFDPNKYAPKPVADPFTTFQSVLIDGGYEIDGPVQVTDDTPVRLNRNGSKDKPAWYHFNLFRTDNGDDIGFGHFGDWRDGVTTSWSSRADQMSEADSIRLDVERKRQADEARKAREIQQDAAAESASAYIDQCTTPLNHPYLTEKGVKGYGLLERNGALVMPLKNSAGEIRSYQTIRPDGAKRFLKDAQKNGCFHLIGQPGNVAYIVEGYATGATVFEATGQGVFVACDTSNLSPVVNAVRSIYPGIRLIIAADHDASGAGQKAANKAASRDSNTSVIVANINPDDGSDFNDLAKAKGLAVVRDQLQPLGEVRKPRSQRFGELKSTAPEWIVHGVIPKDSLIMMFGPSGGGKSFVALDMAFHIALGRPWQGNNVVRQGGVYYICGEGSNGIRRRGDAWAKFHGVDLHDVEFYKTVSAVPLSDPDELQATIDDIIAIGGIRVVQIDTLNRNFGAGDENSTEDMTAFVQACDRIRTECDVTVQVVHHTGLNHSDRARGSSALKAASDVEIALHAEDGSDGFGLVGKKMKDGPNIPMMQFNLVPVMLGVDELGEEYGSCVIERDGTSNPELAQKMIKMGKHQQAVYVSAKALHAQILKNLGADASPQFTAANLYESIAEGKRPRSDKFKEALASLVDRELISFDAPFYHLVAE